MSGLLLDLVNQVRGQLPTRFGGTANDRGWANDALIAPYPNGSGSTITRGTVVQLALYETIGGAISSDTRIIPTTTASQQNVLGVVVGRVSTTTTPVGQYEDEDPDDGEIAAVCLFGRCIVQTESSVTNGQFAYSAATDGTAFGDDNVKVGSMGQFETSSSSGMAWVRLFGSTATPGVFGAILVVFGDNAAAIEPGMLVDIPAPPFSIRLTHWTLVSTLTGSIQLDIRNDTYANYPPSATDTIINASPPLITSGIKNEADVPFGHDSFGTPTGWVGRDIDDGDVVRFIVTSADGGVKQVSLLLDYLRR